MDEGSIFFAEEDGARRLIDACVRGDRNTVEWLLDEGIPVDAHDDDELTPLQAAAAAGRVQLVELLLDRGADVQLCNQIGLTPILHASFHGHEAVVELLLQRGANIHTQTYMGATALSLTVLNGHLELARKLLSYGIELNPCEHYLVIPALMAAALDGHDEICKLLVSRGSNVNHRVIPLNKLNALSLVAICGHTSTARTLLEAGADADSGSIKDWTPYELAKMNMKADLVDVLETHTSVRKNG